MAGKGKMRTSLKRKNNPTSRQPRFKRPSVAFDGSTVNADTLVSFVPTAAAGYVSTNLSVDCSGVSNSVVTTCSYFQRELTNFYSEFWYRKLNVEWLPAVGPADVQSGAQIYLAYIDNAEHIANVVTNTSAAAHLVNRDIIINDKGFKMWNAWEHVKFSVPLTKRLKTFQVNRNISYGDINEVNRCVQGMLAVFMQASTPSSVTLGRFRVSYSIEFRGLDFIST